MFTSGGKAEAFPKWDNEGSRDMWNPKGTTSVLTVLITYWWYILPQGSVIAQVNFHVLTYNRLHSNSNCFFHLPINLYFILVSSFAGKTGALLTMLTRLTLVSVSFQIFQTFVFAILWSLRNKWRINHLDTERSIVYLPPVIFGLKFVLFVANKNYFQCAFVVKKIFTYETTVYWRM